MLIVNKHIIKSSEKYRYFYNKIQIKEAFGTHFIALRILSSN